MNHSDKPETLADRVRAIPGSEHLAYADAMQKAMAG